MSTNDAYDNDTWAPDEVRAMRLLLAMIRCEDAHNSSSRWGDRRARRLPGPTGAHHHRAGVGAGGAGDDLRQRGEKAKHAHKAHLSRISLRSARLRRQRSELVRRKQELAAGLADETSQNLPKPPEERPGGGSHTKAHGSHTPEQKSPPGPSQTALYRRMTRQTP